MIRGVPLRIYVPGEGYLENNYYRINKVVERLGGDEKLIQVL